MHRPRHHVPFALVLTGSALFWSASCARPRAEAPPQTLRRLVVVEDGAPLGVGKRIDLPDMLTLDGRRLTPSELAQGRRAIVVVMASATCPVSTDYGPRLAAAEREYANREVGFVYVNAVDAETPQDMQDQVRRFGFAGPYIPDTDHAVGRALAARTTTEVFVFDPTWTLIYRGGVDDQFGIGSAATAPTRTFLRDAIDATLANQTPQVSATWAPGCLVDLSRPSGTPRTDLTYYGRIATIVQASCLPCHSSAGAAPFSLSGLENIRGRTSMIAAVVRDGLMPPTHGLWLAPGEPNPWRQPRVLSAADRADLLAWLTSEQAIGTPASTAAAPATDGGWSIGTPEQVLMTPMLKLPREGPLQRTRSLVPLVNETDSWATAVEFRPVKPGSVVRALVWLLPPGGVLPRPDRTPEGLELFGTYSPGFETIRYRPGAARRLPAGSALVLDVYARPMGRDMSASLRIAMRTQPSRPEREVRMLYVGTRGATVPAGAGITAITPTMAAPACTLRVSVTAPSQPTELLLEASHLDPRWLVRFEPAGSLRLPPGSRLSATVTPGAATPDWSEPDGDGAVWLEYEIEPAAAR